MFFPFWEFKIYYILISLIRSKHRLHQKTKNPRLKKNKITIFLTFKNYFISFTIIDSRSIGDPMDRSRFPRKVPSDCRTVRRHRHGRPQLSSAWSSHGEIAMYTIGSMSQISSLLPHLPRNFSDATLPTIHTRATTPFVDDSRDFIPSLLLSAASFCVSSCPTRRRWNSPTSWTLSAGNSRGTLFYRQSRLRWRFLLRLHFHSSSFSE